MPAVSSGEVVHEHVYLHTPAVSSSEGAYDTYTVNVFNTRVKYRSTSFGMSSKVVSLGYVFY